MSMSAVPNAGTFGTVSPVKSLTPPKTAPSYMNMSHKLPPPKNPLSPVPDHQKPLTQHDYAKSFLAGPAPVQPVCRSGAQTTPD